MFKTTDSKTAEHFTKKGYKVFSLGLFRGWVMYAPDEKIPNSILQAEEQKNKPKRKYRKKKLIRIKKVLNGRKKIRKLRLSKKKRKNK